MALRRRARKSAIGSVIFSSPSLPARLDDAGDLSLQRQRTEAEATHIELAHVGARPAAERTATTDPNGPLFLARNFLCETCHVDLYCRNGIPKKRSSARPSSSVAADVTIEMFSPLILSILS